MTNGNRGTRPPALLFVITCLLLVATLALFPVDHPLALFPVDGIDFSLPFFDRSGDQNTVGFLVGSVLGTAMLGVFLIQDNKRRATMRYSDWSLFSPRAVAPYITGVTWALGVTHMFFWAKDLTRA